MLPLSRRAPLRRALPVLCSLLAWSSAPPAGAAQSSLESPSATNPIRDREVAGEVPTISFIDSPTAICYRPQEFGQACLVAWDYLYVAATSPQYLVGMTVEIGGRLRATLQGFFQSDMFVPSGMFAPGFTVVCGQPGASGIPNHGNQYAYTIRAEESGGLSSANYGTVLCPATRVIFVNGFAGGNAAAWSALVP